MSHYEATFKEEIKLNGRDTNVYEIREVREDCSLFAGYFTGETKEEALQEFYRQAENEDESY